MHDKTNEITCAPSQDSDQPGHPPCLISLRCPHEESLGPWLPFECTAKLDQTPGPMGAVLKNDVNYVLVVCNPGPFGAGDTARVKWQCHVLTSASSPQCCGTTDMGLLILMPRRPRLFHICMPGFEQDFLQGFDHKNIPAVLGTYPSFTKRKVNISAVLWPHRARGYKWLQFCKLWANSPLLLDFTGKVVPTSSVIYQNVCIYV